MVRHTFCTIAALAIAIAPGSGIAAAQSLGSFSWQLAPYCNVVTLTVTQNGAIYTLDGYDNQCGTTSRAPVTGMGVLNTNGTVEFGLTIVTTPGGTPVHVQATVNPSTLGGEWHDSHGGAGPLTFAPSGIGTGAPRPLSVVVLPDASVTTPKLADSAVNGAKIADGSIGALDIDTTQVQRRVQGGCPAGQLMTRVNADGTVVCEAVASSAGGDITAIAVGAGISGGGVSGDVSLAADFAIVQARVAAACPANQSIRSISDLGAVTCEPDDNSGGDITQVIAGDGLNGGAGSGNATLSVAFSGSGSAATVARSDHFHPAGPLTSSNTAIGNQSLAISSAAGSNNTAVGHAVMGEMISGGSGNTGVGAFAMQDQTDGVQNTAVGSFALQSNTSGTMNTAIGREALYQLVGESLGVGSRNTAVGKASLSDLGDGYNNTAIGAFSGDGLTAGRDNIYIGSAAGGAAESFTTRIGTGFAASRTFVAGIRGVTTGVNDAVTVVVDSAGQLGTVSSSRETKFDIGDVAAPVTSALQRLRPVHFRYRQAFADGSTPLQYGLIAEEVQEVLPELVALDTNGEPETVKYHVLPALLLADVQRLERERVAQNEVIDALKARLAELERALTAREPIAVTSKP